VQAGRAGPGDRQRRRSQKADERLPDEGNAERLGEFLAGEELSPEDLEAAIEAELAGRRR